MVKSAKHAFQSLPLQFIQPKIKAQENYKDSTLCQPKFCVQKKVKPKLIVFTCCHDQCRFLQVFLVTGCEIWLCCGVNYNSLCTVIGCEITTVFMLVNEMVTVCKHRMVMAVSAKMLVV